MKRIFALLLSLAVLFSCLAVTAGAMFDPSTVYDVKAQSAYIVNTDTNIIVYEKDSEKQVSAGGLTKYMTIALVLTNYADQLDSTFTMPFAISDYVHNSDNADMRSGETFTYREALYAMVMRNANEAAMGLAYELSGGDLAGWVSQMNTLSQRIGTTNSTWTDACGLDSGNTTTAVDMYLILRYLMSFDAFKEISAAPTFTMPAKQKHAKSFVLLSQNVALNKTSGGRFYRSAMQGGMCDVMAYKNDSGDQNYVSWANKDGATYIFCIMQSPDTCDDYGYSNRRPALYETTKLIDWVFESFSIQAALDTDQALAEIPVKYSSDTDTLQLYPADIVRHPVGGGEGDDDLAAAVAAVGAGAGKPHQRPAAQPPQLPLAQGDIRGQHRDDGAFILVGRDAVIQQRMDRRARHDEVIEQRMVGEHQCAHGVGFSVQFHHPGGGADAAFQPVATHPPRPAPTAPSAKSALQSANAAKTCASVTWSPRISFRPQSLHSQTTGFTLPVVSQMSGFFSSIYFTSAVCAVPTLRVLVNRMGVSSVPSSSICTRPVVLPKPLMT